MNNTSKHISDQASTVIFNPANTDWPVTVLDVQSALADLGGWCRKSTGLPVATQTTLGVISLADLEEATLGVDQNKAITPFTLKEVMKKPQATETEYGTTKYATTAERTNTTNNVTAITPLGLDYVFNNRPATETKFGSARIATQSQAETGNDDSSMMTPLKTKQAINVHVKAVATSTESVMGISKMATAQEIQAGVAREGVAISPYAFANARGTSSAYGTFKSASSSDVIAGTAIDKAITPKALFDSKGSVSNYGIVGLSTSVASGLPNHALAANAAVLPTAGGTMTGDILYNSTGKGVRWNFNTDFAHVTFHSTGDQDPNTRMEFVVGDNHTEYFTWKSDGPGGVREIMRATPDKKLYVYNGIYDRNELVYSPLNKPSPETLGAIRNQWGEAQLSGELNVMDGIVDYHLPKKHVQVGMYSWHSNNTEDRVWRIYYRIVGS